MKLKFVLVLFLFSTTFFEFSKGSTDSSQSGLIKIDGILKQWHTITLDIQGPEYSESSLDNPFLNVRLQVDFRHKDTVFSVPGYFAADGNAGESEAKSGKVWRVHFTPNLVGEWSYTIEFVHGEEVAVNGNKGAPLEGNGRNGSFFVENSSDSDLLYIRRGRLKNAGNHYLRFEGNSSYFLKCGAGSPENFLAYDDFDGTYSIKAQQREGEAISHGLKTWLPHLQDWKKGDPTWHEGKGKAIIGALNYLASKGVNSLYFLTMNVYGDGQDVWPWVSPYERVRYDCSKLDQWKIVLEHMQNLGIVAHVITQETENELLLDMGNTGTERKLYYRELIARFGHILGLIWNLGEENGYAPFTPNAQNTKQRLAMSAYLKANDPFQHPVVLHTHAAKHERDEILQEVLLDPNLDGPSFQIERPSNVHAATLQWRETSRKNGHPWVLPLDEIGPAGTGAKPDVDDPEHDEIRSQALWGNLVAGGSGVDWYFGYKFAQNDLFCEDFRSRDILWEQTETAVSFFQKHLPFVDMHPTDSLTDLETDFVLSKTNDVYCIYLPVFEPFTLDLTEANGDFQVNWFNPKTGGNLLTGNVTTVSAGAKVSLGTPPSNPKQDWVILVKRIY